MLPAIRHCCRSFGTRQGHLLGGCWHKIDYTHEVVGVIACLQQLRITEPDELNDGQWGTTYAPSAASRTPPWLPSGGDVGVGVFSEGEIVVPAHT